MPSSCSPSGPGSPPRRPGADIEGDDVGVADRVDLLATYSLYLVLASLAAGLGFALRLVANYTVARTGGSVTGVRAGEPLPSVRRWPPAKAVTETEPEA